jgi:hypothetical protein
MKKYLIIETFPFSPHIETAAEIAMQLKKKNEVYFFWCGYDLPWKDWELPWYKKLLLFSYEKKISNLISFLEKKNINIIPKFNLTLNKVRFINKSINNIKDLSKIDKYKYKNKISLGASVISSLISKYHNLDLKFKNYEILSCIKSSCIVFERSLHLINNLNPDYVVTFNSRFAISKPIIEAAKIKKKKILIHERASDLNKYAIHTGDIFDKNYFYNNINKYWNLEKNKKKKVNIAKKYFHLLLNKKLLKRSGYNFELNSLNRINFDKKKLNIVFFCSTEHEFSSVSYQKKDFYLSDNWKKQINAINSIIKIIKKDEKKYLYIKAHPNFSNHSNQDKLLKTLENSQVQYLSNKQCVDSISLVKESDIIITFGSSLELLALYLNKKVISLFKALYSKFNLFYYPKNEKQLEWLLNNSVKEKISMLKIFKISYYYMNHGTLFKRFKTYKFSRGEIINEGHINHYGTILNLFLRIKFIRKLCLKVL